VTEQHLTSAEQHTVDVSEGSWRLLAPTGYWYISCTCGEWDANSVPTDQVESVRRQHEEMMKQ
jgi:hypothetical protein